MDLMIVCKWLLQGAAAWCCAQVPLTHLRLLSHEGVQINTAMLRLCAHRTVKQCFPDIAMHNRYSSNVHSIKDELGNACIGPST